MRASRGVSESSARVAIAAHGYWCRCAPELVTEHVGVLGALEGDNKFGDGRCCLLLLACLVLRGGQQGRGVLAVRVKLERLRRGLQGLVMHLLLQQEHRALQQALASQVRAAALHIAELQCPAVPAGLEIRLRVRCPFALAQPSHHSVLDPGYHLHLI